MHSKYIMGIDELDSQHEEIEKICIALEGAVEEKDRWRNLLEKLCERLRFHFNAEESIMEIFAYPESQKHKRLHLRVINLIESYKRDAARTDDKFVKKLSIQPIQLILEQIFDQDIKFASFFKRNKERLGIQ